MLDQFGTGLVRLHVPHGPRVEAPPRSSHRDGRKGSVRPAASGRVARAERPVAWLQRSEPLRDSNGVSRGVTRGE